MKGFIKTWLEGLTENQQPPSGLSVEHAAAVLLVEIMAADHEWDDVEANTIRRLLQDNFHLDESEAADLLDQSQNSQREANDLYAYTTVINEHFKPEQKYQLISNLWQVAYADGNLDRYEEHMIRKIAELIHVPHSQFIKAKLDVAQHL